jgi:hypothetical protein
VAAHPNERRDKMRERIADRDINTRDGGSQDRDVRRRIVDEQGENEVVVSEPYTPLGVKIPLPRR